MPVTHLLIALGIVAIWGSNFVVIKLGLAHWPPMLFVALRFAVSSLPVLLLPRPKVPVTLLAAYGLFIGVGQFGLLFYAMQRDISPGLASLIIQMQVFFTIGLSAWLFGEAVRLRQIAGIVLAAAGLLLIAVQSTQLPLSAQPTTDDAPSALGLGLVLLAAFNWSVGNVIAKRAGGADVLSFISWSSLFPALVLAGLSLLLEGRAPVLVALVTAGGGAWVAVLWQALANTLVGYGAWSWLLARHPAAAVAPTALLVPVFGMGASSLVLGESLPTWKMAAGLMVISGLGITVLGGLRKSPWRR